MNQNIPNNTPRPHKREFYTGPYANAADVMHAYQLQHSAPALEDERHGFYDDNDSPYKLAFTDEEFLLRKETREILFKLEMLKPDLIMREMGIEQIIDTFGATRFMSTENSQELMAAAKTPVEGSIATKALKGATYLLAMCAIPRGYGTLDEMFDKTLKTINSLISYCFPNKQCFA